MMGSSAIAAEGAGQKAYGIEEALIERGFTVNPDMMAFCADASMDQYRMQSMLFGQVSYGHALSVAFDTVVDAPNTYFVGEAQVSLYEDQILGAGNAADAIGSSTGGAWNYADEVSYPFGYGLSYTTFERKLEDVQLEVGGTGTAKVTVTNTGDAAGKCAVQLYVQAPYTAGGVEKAAIQLLAFGKTDILAPGASQTLEIEFDPTYMASYDETAVKADGTTGAWSLEAGDYYFAVGNGAHEALNSVLAKKLGTEEGLLTVNESEIIDAENAFLWTLDAADIETYSAGVQNVLQEAD
ncbi:MAG: fibronectin type III-like domain-contianing protein, partial [Clostridia bacterium]|nr:fibronectin type III-like domain-contianing protein [Clostridia bacterium]